jgi:hypothetical protein
MDSSGYVEFPLVASNNLSVADVSAIVGTGDRVYIARIAPNDWTPTANRYIAAQTNGFRFILLSGGNLYLGVWDNTVTERISNRAITEPADGEWLYVAVAFTPDNGAAQRVHRTYQSDDGLTWTLVATDTIAGAVVVNVPGTPIKIGSNGGTTEQFDGKIQMFSHRIGGSAGSLTDGTEVFRFDEYSLVGTTNATTSFIAETGQVVTVNRSGASQTLIVPPLFFGVRGCSVNDPPLTEQLPYDPDCSGIVSCVP